MSTRQKPPREDKIGTVAELTELFSKSSACIVTHYRGMSVSDISALRNQLRPTGAQYVVTKNTLMRRALGGALTDEISTLLSGPTAIAFAGEDVVGAAKGIADFIRQLKKEDVVIKGGLFDGVVYSGKQVEAIAKLPPKPQIQAQVVGTIQAPLNNFAGTMQGILSEFARTLQALADQKQAA